DGCADEDVRLAAHELEHDLFEFGGRHLAVADDDAGIGGEFLDLIGDGGDVEDAVVDEVDLAIAGELAGYGLLDAGFVERDQFGDDGAAVERGRGEAGDIPQAEHGHVERARDGRGGEGEDIDRHAEAEEALFVLHAESLLFIDDDETEVAELDIGGKK